MTFITDLHHIHYRCKYSFFVVSFGHVVVDLNLKGMSHWINGQMAMKIISKQLMKQLIELDVNTYGKIYGCTSHHCGENGEGGG